MGREILELFGDLMDNPELLECFHLFLGVDIEPIKIHVRNISYGFEEWWIDTLGRLVYNFTGKSDGDSAVRNDNNNSEEMILSSLRDFKRLSYESIKSLYQEVMMDNFFDKLAWLIGRSSDPGFDIDGYEEEQDTWRLKSADAEELKHLSKIHQKNWRSNAKK